MKKDYEEIQEYWSEFYTGMAEKLREDKLGIYSVCYAGRSAWRNKFIDWLQNRTFQKLFSKCGSLQGKETLDVGTGAGRWAARLMERGLKVTAIDSNERMIERNKSLFKEIDFRKMLITNLDFQDNYFDLVTSVTVLHHIPYERQKEAIKEIVRITRKYILILESINVNSKDPTMFANSPSKWIELFGENGCKKIAWLGYEYIPLIRVVNYLYSISRLFAPSRYAKKSTRAHKSESPRARKDNIRSFISRSLERSLIALSYPLEIFCHHIVPNRFARQAGILFQKDISA